jgi:hypothetical protein
VPLVVTRSRPASDAFSQSLEGVYFEGSEGAEGVINHQVHFSISQLETGATIACKWEPKLADLLSKALQVQFLHQVYG